MVFGNGSSGHEEEEECEYAGILMERNPTDFVLSLVTETAAVIVGFMPECHRSRLSQVNRSLYRALVYCRAHSGVYLFP